MTPRITMMPVAARVESFTTGGIGAGGVGGDSTTGSPGCERLPTVAAELQVAGVRRVARGADGLLRRPTVPAELLARGDRLTALHTRLARRRGHVRAAVPAELHRGGLLGVALRARLDLLRGLHLAHLARHRVAHADARSEPEACARAALRVRGRRLQGVRHRELLGAGRRRAAQDPTRGRGRDRLLHLLREWDVQPADLDDLDPEVLEVGLRLHEDPLLDLVQVRRELRDLQSIGLHLAQRHIELLHHLVANPVLDFCGGRGTECADELIDERFRRPDAIPELTEGTELDEVEVRVLEDVRVLRAELAIEDSLLEVEDLRLLDNPGEDPLEPTENRYVLGCERVPVRSVEVGKGLPVTVEHRDLVLPDDDVVVHPDVSRDLPHDVAPLELVVPGNRHRGRHALSTACGLVCASSAAEQEHWEDHRFAPVPVIASIRRLNASSKARRSARSCWTPLSNAALSAASAAARSAGTFPAARSRPSIIA